MTELDIQKTKMVQIESMAETIKMYFGKNNKELEKEMEKLVELIKEERKSKEMISSLLNTIANRV